VPPAALLGREAKDFDKGRGSPTAPDTIDKTNRRENNGAHGGVARRRWLRICQRRSVLWLKALYGTYQRAHSHICIYAPPCVHFFVVRDHRIVKSHGALWSIDPAAIRFFLFRKEGVAVTVEFLNLATRRKTEAKFSL